jgi:hypothetical protein
MRKNSLYVLIIVLAFMAEAKAQVFGGEAAKKVYKSEDFKEAIESHKTVAILPYKANITYKKKPKDFNAEAVKEDEAKLATTMQQGMYTYLLKNQSKYSVTFQEVDRTNALLKKAGLYDKLDESLAEDLAKALGVDAVIKCVYDHEIVGGSEGGQIAKALLFGAANRTGSGGLTMQIYDGKKGNLLWRFYKEMNESLFSNANEIMDRMMRKVNRNFPY